MAAQRARNCGRTGRHPDVQAGQAGGCRRPVAYKLSSNEIPYGPLPAVLEASRRRRGFNRYPDMAGGGLTAELARRFGVPLTHLAIGTGSVGVAQSAAAVDRRSPGDEVLYAWRSFEAYPILTQISGRGRSGTAAAGEAHDLDAMADAITTGPG